MNNIGVIGGADGVFIMLDDNHRIAQITQMNQRAEQTFVIALMQADGRLIQHIHHADQAGANLACQANTLASPPESVSAERESVR